MLRTAEDTLHTLVCFVTLVVARFTELVTLVWLELNRVVSDIMLAVVCLTWVCAFLVRRVRALSTCPSLPSEGCGA